MGSMGVGTVTWRLRVGVFYGSRASIKQPKCKYRLLSLAFLSLVTFLHNFVSMLVNFNSTLFDTCDILAEW